MVKKWPNSIVIYKNFVLNIWGYNIVFNYFSLLNFDCFRFFDLDIYLLIKRLLWSITFRNSNSNREKIKKRKYYYIFFSINYNLNFFILFLLIFIILLISLIKSSG
jgi:hypothetical protein